MKKPLYRSLYFQVITAIVIGILLGYFFPETGAAMKPLGDGFIKLIKMMIAPIIFCTVVVGIAGMESMKTVGKTGGYAVLYFEAVSALVLGIIARLHGFSIWKFIKYIKEELFIVLGTSSSESVLPRMIAKLENLGCGQSVVGLVIPTGYSFNLDGTCIYLTMAAIFLAQATNTELPIW